LFVGGRGVANDGGTAEANITRSETSHASGVHRPVNSRCDLAAIYGVGASIFSRRPWRKKAVPPSVTREPRSMMPEKSPKPRQIGNEHARVNSAPLRSAPLGLGPSDARREKWLFHAEAFVMNRQTRWRVGRARWCAPRARRHGRRRRACAARAGSPRRPRRARAWTPPRRSTRARAWRRKPRWARSASSPRARWSAPGAASARACTCSATSSSARGACSARTRWWARRYVARDAERDGTRWMRVRQD